MNLICAMQYIQAVKGVVMFVVLGEVARLGIALVRISGYKEK